MRFVAHPNPGGGGPALPSGLRLGYADAELPAIRTRLQTTGADRTLFLSYIGTLNTQFSAAFPHGLDAGHAAMAAADLYMLNPEDPSWGTDFTSLTAINTQAKCLQLASDIIRTSRYHRSTLEAVGNTCLEYLSDASTLSTSTDGSGSEPVHIWYNIPTITGAAVWYVWERIQAAMDGGERQEMLDAMLEWVDGSLADIGSGDYPEYSGARDVQITNHGMSSTRHLNIAGAQVLLGTVDADAGQQALISDAFQRAYINRFKLEIDNLVMIEGQPAPGTNEGGSCGLGYFNDNASGIARLGMYAYPHPDWQTADPIGPYLEKLPEAMLKGLFPGDNASNSTMRNTWQYGVVGTDETQMTLSGQSAWLLAAAMVRHGYTTAARQLRWIMDNYMSQVSVGGVSILSQVNSTAFRNVWHWWHIMIGGGTVYGLTPLAITGFTTRKAHHGSLIDTELFTNPSRGSWVGYALYRKWYTSRLDPPDHCGRLAIWTRGAWVQHGYIGTSKGSFGGDGGAQFAHYSSVSRSSIWQPSTPWTIDGRGYNVGFPPLSATYDPSMAAAENATDFKLVAEEYASDPDHATGFYSGLERWWDASEATKVQDIRLTRLDKDLVFAFVRHTPASGRTSSYVWTTTVRPEFHDGTETVPDHFLAGNGLAPATPAKGVRLSSDATTVVGVADYSSFTATDGTSTTMPEANAKWFHTLLSLEADYRWELRGYDPTYVHAAIRDNLEIQPGTSEYGRNSSSVWQGIASAHTNGVASTVIELADLQALGGSAPVFPHTITYLAVSAAGVGTPTYYVGTYNSTTKQFTKTGAAITISAGTPYNYDLIDTNDNAERAFNSSSDGDDVRKVIGEGTVRILGTTTGQPINWCVVCKMGAADDGGFTDPPTYHKLEETDVWGVYVEEDDIAVVVAVDPDDASDLAGYDFLLPTTATTEVHCCDVRPGTYAISRATEGGVNTRVTLTPSGAFTVGASGRIVLSVATGGVTLA